MSRKSGRDRRGTDIFGLMFVALAVSATRLAAAATEPIAPPDVEGQFRDLKHHGEALGWVLPEAQGAADPSVSDHYQGVVRFPGDGTPVFYVTQRDNDDSIRPGAANKGGYLEVIRMGSRPTSGERLRSNLLRIGLDTESTAPPPVDTWVRDFRFDGSIVAGGEVLPAYDHPGGMAIVDDVLFVSLDQPHRTCILVPDECTYSTAIPGQIVLFDLRPDRENPTPLRFIPLNHPIDNLAVLARPGRTHLIWVNGGGGEVTKFYETSTSDLRDPGLSITELQDWSPGSSEDFDGAGEGWDEGADAEQSATFVRQADGVVYMVMTRNTSGPASFDDIARLFRVDEKPGGGFRLTRAGSRHMVCNFEGSGRICHFAAASSAYVTPSGELILYSVPHDDQDGFDPDFVRMAEFRHRDANREGSPLRSPGADAGGPYSVPEGGAVTLSGTASPAADRPWVELYGGAGFADRSIVVDYDARDLLEMDDFTGLDGPAGEGFSDKASSVRWRLPAGLEAVLYDLDHFGGAFIVLEGTGHTESIADLDHDVVTPFSERGSSLRLVGSGEPVIPTPTWDLDGDAVFGESGPAAGRGDEIGSAPSLFAVGLDGPSDLSARLRACVPSACAGDAASVEVLNVPPSVSAGPDVTIVSGAFHQVAAVFTDPGVPDIHTATIDWGDGSPIESAGVAEFRGSGTAAGRHRLTVPGRYTVLTCVSDDDGGTACDAQVVTVIRLRVAINIKPGDTPNAVNAQGRVPVAVLTTHASEYQTLADFDATRVDISSVRFGPLALLDAGGGGTEVHGQAHVQDARERSDEKTRDGDLDIVLHFAPVDSGLAPTDLEAWVRGVTLDDVHFEGHDAIRLVPE